MTLKKIFQSIVAVVDRKSICRCREAITETHHQRNHSLLMFVVMRLLAVASNHLRAFGLTDMGLLDADADSMKQDNRDI